MADKEEKRRKKGSGQPLDRLARARIAMREGEPDWFEQRRARRPATERPAAGGVGLSRDLLHGANELVHGSFLPEEATVTRAPTIVSEPETPMLRRFSGVRVIPANHTWIENGDGRQLYCDASYPWCCIGQVITRTGRGTGTLAGENFILTASHVVSGLWANGRPLTESITFVPGMFNGQSVLGPTWTAQVTGIAAWQDINWVAGYDVAILQLDQPMGDWLGYFGSRGYDEDWEGNAWWEHAGYPYDMSPNGDEPCYELGVTIDDDDDDDYDTVELETDADIASGQSGGPLWAVFDGDNRQIIGVLSGREDATFESSNIFAGGSGLNGLVRWGRDNWH